MNLGGQLQCFLGTAGRDITECFLAVFIFLFPCVMSEVLVCPQVFKGKVGVLLGECADYWIGTAPCGLEFDMLAVKFLWRIHRIIAVAVSFGSPMCNRPVIPVVFSVFFTFGHTEICSSFFMVHLSFLFGFGRKKSGCAFQLRRTQPLKLNADKRVVCIWF